MKIYRRTEIEDVINSLLAGHDEFAFWQWSMANAYRQEGDAFAVAVRKAFFTTARIFCLATRELARRGHVPPLVYFSVPDPLQHPASVGDCRRSQLTWPCGPPTHTPALRRTNLLREPSPGA